MRRLTAPKASSDQSRRVLAAGWKAVKFALAFLLTWFAFFLAGQFLARSPQEFHNGAVWRELR